MIGYRMTPEDIPLIHIPARYWHPFKIVKVKVEELSDLCNERDALKKENSRLTTRLKMMTELHSHFKELHSNLQLKNAIKCNAIYNILSQ